MCEGRKSRIKRQWMDELDLYLPTLPIVHKHRGDLGLEFMRQHLRIEAIVRDSPHEWFEWFVW